MRRFGVIALIALAALPALPAGGGVAHSPQGTATYYRLRPDLRLCPSPACGGSWVRRANRAETVCGNGTAAAECYAATFDLSALALSDERRAVLGEALARGTPLARGRLVRSAAGGPPRLDALVVSEVWLRHGLARARGTVFRVEDNGVRCVREPCFSLHASTVNTPRHQDVSAVDLAASGASRAAVNRGRAALDDAGVLVEGRVVAAGEGRVLRVSAFWLRAA